MKWLVVHNEDIVLAVYGYRLEREAKDRVEKIYSETGIYPMLSEIESDVRPRVSSPLFIYIEKNYVFIGDN